jgi:hypothetical protein
LSKGDALAQQVEMARFGSRCILGWLGAAMPNRNCCAEASHNQSTGEARLGLVIVASQVRAHGGVVELRNGDEGGLRASARLPLKAASDVFSKKTPGAAGSDALDQGLAPVARCPRKTIGNPSRTQPSLFLTGGLAPQVGQFETARVGCRQPYSDISARSFKAVTDHRFKQWPGEIQT